jgi:hypothetical protein
MPISSQELTYFARLVLLTRAGMVRGRLFFKEIEGMYFPANLNRELAHCVLSDPFPNFQQIHRFFTHLLGGIILITTKISDARYVLRIRKAKQ